jgi:outer membrane protein TolC
MAMKMGAERGPAVREAKAPVGATPAIRDAASSVLPYSPRMTAFAGRRDGAFGSGLEIGGSVTQDLSVRGLGGARRNAAEAIDLSTRHNVDRARLEGAATALLAWLDVLEAQQLVRLREVARADAEEIARVANARVERGVAMPVEASLAAAEVGAASLGERDAEGRLVEARAMLKFALGLPPLPDVVATGDLDGDDGLTAPPPPPREHPAEVAARSRVALAEADAKLARAQASPPVGIGINVSREGQGERLVTGTFTLPLPILDPSRFDAARQHANVLTAEAHVMRVRDELARDNALTTHERIHTREVRDTLRTRVLVPLRETVRLARASYQAGTQDATGLLLLRQRLVLAEEQLGHASAEVKRADVRHALARGTLLEEGSR